MNWALNFNKKIKFKYYLSNFIIIFGDILSLVSPILTGVIIDKGLLGGDFSLVLKLGLIIIGLTVFRIILSYFGVIYLDRTMEMLAKEIRVKCYGKLNTLDRSYFNKTELGEITTILTTDISNIRHNLSYTLKTVIVMVVTFLGTFIYGLMVNWILILLILSVMPFMAFFTRRYIKKAPKLYEERRDLLSKLNNRIQENIEGNKIVKNFGLEEIEIEKFKKDNSNLKNKSIDIAYVGIKNFTAINFFAYLMDTIMITSGGILYFFGKITIGNIIAIYTMLWNLQRPFYELDELLDLWQRYKISKRRVSNLLAEVPKIKNEGTITLDKINTIEFINVDVNYDEKVGIKNLNLRIKKGDTVAFIGEVGSGKSTITNLLLRYVDPDRGEVLINGINIKDYELKSLRERIGYVAQTPFLFSETIYENIVFGNKALKEDEIDKYIKMAKADYVYKLPEGINTIIGENGVTLSGGEKQRLTLARALAVEPELLILDDITSALDTETELEVTKNINNLKYNCTKVVVAGKIISVKNADVICVLKNNKIVEKGSHDDLLRLKGHYREIYDIQMNGLIEGANYEC